MASLARYVSSCQVTDPVLTPSEAAGVIDVLKEMAVPSGGRGMTNDAKTLSTDDRAPRSSRPVEGKARRGRAADDGAQSQHGDLEGAADQVFTQVRPALQTAGDWSDAAQAGLGQLVHVLQRDPDAIRVLFVDGLAGGKRTRTQRKLVAEEFEQLAQAFLDSPPTDGRTLDIPAPAVMGALRNIVSEHMRSHVEDRLPALVQDGLTWVQAYAIPSGQARWSTGPQARLNNSPSIPDGLVAESERDRILQAAADAMLAKGYEGTTISDIAAAAGVSRDVVREHFVGKRHIFLEAQQYPTQYILDTCAAAYFSARDWPERVWSGLRALVGLIVANPSISHLRLVECYAAGPAAIRRAEEITRSFMFFLQEGYSYRPEAQALPRLCSEAIAGAVFEIIQRGVARGETDEMLRWLPQLAYIVITPFVGREQATDLLEHLIAREQQSLA